jgi:hypothetical protein
MRTRQISKDNSQIWIRTNKALQYSKQFLKTANARLPKQVLRKHLKA